MSRQVKKVNISGKEDKSNKVTSWSSTTTDTHYPSEKLVKDSLDGKQDELVSGTNLKTLNGVDLLGEGDIAIDVSCGDDYGSTVIFEEDGSVDHSSTLFGEHISLRNSGTATATYNNNGYYVLTNTKESAECFIEFPLLQGICNKSFKVTVRSQGTTTYRCPIGLYYYLDDNNWGGVKDEIAYVWTSAKTNGVFTENSTATDNSDESELVSEFIFDSTTNTLIVKDYVEGVLKETRSMVIPIQLTSSVKWGTTTTWANNTSRNLYEIKAEYIYNETVFSDTASSENLSKYDTTHLTGQTLTYDSTEQAYKVSIGTTSVSSLLIKDITIPNQVRCSVDIKLVRSSNTQGGFLLMNSSENKGFVAKSVNQTSVKRMEFTEITDYNSHSTAIVNSSTYPSDPNNKWITYVLYVDEDTYTIYCYYDNDLYSTVTATKTGLLSATGNLIGLNTCYNNGSQIYFKNFNVEVTNQVSDSENTIYLGDDIMTMIDTALGHMITNWEDYE